MRISVIIISDGDWLLKCIFEEYNTFSLEIRENYSVFFYLIQVLGISQVLVYTKVYDPLSRLWSWVGGWGRAGDKVIRKEELRGQGIGRIIYTDVDSQRIRNFQVHLYFEASPMGLAELVLCDL